jgi:NAD(P)H dehydrogenase (quinone)
MSKSETNPTVLVMGATGQVGGAVIKYLKTRPGIKLLSAARSLERAESLGVPTVFLDLNRRDTIVPALAGVDRLFMVTGYTVEMLRQSKDIVNAAKQVGVKHIVHLGACGDDDTPVTHYGWHQFVERYIECSGISFTHLRPEIFMQNLMGYGNIKVVDAGVVRHYVGDARLSWVDCDDVALVGAIGLLNPERHAGKTYHLGYDAKSCYDVADALTRLLRQRFVYARRPPNEFLKNVLAADAEPAYMQCVQESFELMAKGQLPRSDIVYDNFEKLTAQRPHTLDDFILKHAAKFRY